MSYDSVKAAAHFAVAVGFFLLFVFIIVVVSAVWIGMVAGNSLFVLNECSSKRKQMI